MGGRARFGGRSLARRSHRGAPGTLGPRAGLCPRAGRQRRPGPSGELCSVSAWPPGGGELARTLAKTPPGAAQRAFRRALLMFARPWQIPSKWIKNLYKLAQLPNFTEATLASLHSAIGPAGQREVLLDKLPYLQMPTLIVWGLEDKLLPYWQAKEAFTRLQHGSLELISNCGHLPHIEQPKQFASILNDFLGERVPH
ncbi:MAG TPA: alpha/beta fold hydrolase [Rubrobacteraceae bacterium]|nr:alpha/beta fold hydrolase [Rubrobacteraceae bacterium]